MRIIGSAKTGFSLSAVKAFVGLVKRRRATCMLFKKTPSCSSVCGALVAQADRRHGPMRRARARGGAKGPFGVANEREAYGRAISAVVIWQWSATSAERSSFDSGNPLRAKIHRTFMHVDALQRTRYRRAHEHGGS